MNEAPIVSGSREEKWFQQMLALHGAPAYVRRAQNVEAAWQQIVERCRRQRHEWLGLARTRLGFLRALAGEWTALEAILAGPDDVAALVQLERELEPTLKARPEPTRSRRRLRHALHELVDSLTYFNERWQAYLAKVDVTEVNRLRHDYNRYYVLEKECAVRSPQIARQGFRPLAPATVAELAALFAPLPVPIFD